MSKKVINTIVKNAGEKSLTGLADKVIFTPTPRQRQVKAKFWARFQPGPFSSPDSISMSEIQHVTGVSGLKEWWSKEGFKEWFLNREEAREKLEYLFMKALDTAEDIMDDPVAQANAKVQAIKVIAELANKFPTKQVERYADADIQRMSEGELKGYLERKGVTFKEEKVIEAEALSNESRAEEGPSDED